MEAVERDIAQGENAPFATTSGSVRGALQQDLKGCGKSRDQVAFELGFALGKAISVEMIDAFVAPSKKMHRFPAEWIPAWIEVTGSRRLIEALCGVVGLSVATEDDRDFAELGRATLRKQRLAEKLWQRS
jgi:hypothetical protein